MTGPTDLHLEATCDIRLSQTGFELTRNGLCIVNEDNVDDRLLDLGLSETDRDFLDIIQQNLPLLADLFRADLSVFCLDASREFAVVVADARPTTVPSVHGEPMVSKRVTAAEEPAVLRALKECRREHWQNDVAARGVQTVQDVFPIVHGGKVIGGLAIEMTRAEVERWPKRGLVLRSAIIQLRDMLLRGQLRGGNTIGPVSEHDGPLVVDSDGRILYISDIAENLYRKLGHTRPLVGSSLRELNSDEAAYYNALETSTCVEQLVEQGSTVWLKKAIPLIAWSKPSWHARLLSRNYEIDGVLLVIHDATEERRKDQELRVKSAMIREVHHRVKNNLQTIASLLRLQCRRLESDAASGLLNHSVNRILSVAVVHEFLSHDESSIIDIKELSQRIINEVTQGIIDSEKRIKIRLEGHSIFLPSQQATSCALIVNELLQNAVEHGFSNKSEGTVVVELQDMGKDLQLEIVDNGQGLGQGFRVGASSSLGLQIVQTLVKEDLKGTFELLGGGGTRAVITFPKLWRGSGIPWAAVE